MPKYHHELSLQTYVGTFFLLLFAFGIISGILQLDFRGSLSHAATGTISASPNPCAIPTGGTQCTTTITWTTAGATDPCVYFGTTLFSCWGAGGPHSASASWITTSNATFDLRSSRSPTASIIASVTVNGVAATAGGTGTIQGVTVKYGDGTVKVPTTVTVTGVGSKTTTATNNAYAFTGVTSGSRTITVANPSGWANPRYNYCVNSTSCHLTATVYSGSSATVNVPAGGYIDLWWYFDPTTTGTIQGNTVIYAGGVGAGTTVTVAGVGSKTTASPSYNYSFANLAKGSRTVSVVTPAGFKNPRYNICYNYTGDATCHYSATSVAGTSVTINVTAGSVTDIWWVFDQIPGEVRTRAFDKSTSAPLSATVTLSDVGSATTVANNTTYSFYPVPPGSKTISVAIPSGYASAEYNICNNCMTTSATWTAGSSATITVPAGGYIYVQWRFILGFNYAISAAAGDLVVNLPNANSSADVSKTINATLTSGATTDVTFSIESNFPPVIYNASTHQAYATFSNPPYIVKTTSCKPGCSVVLTAHADGYVPTGTFPVTVRGNLLSKAVTFNVVIKHAAGCYDWNGAPGQWGIGDTFSWAFGGCIPVSTGGNLLSGLSAVDNNLSGSRGYHFGTQVKFTKTPVRYTGEFAQSYAIIIDGVRVAGNSVATPDSTFFATTPFDVTFNVPVDGGNHSFAIESYKANRTSASIPWIRLNGSSLANGDTTSGCVVNCGGTSPGGIPPTSYGGSGYGPSPVVGALMVVSYFDMSESAIPNYPAIKVDGALIGSRVSLDFASQATLPAGSHTLTVDATPGFDIWMHCANNSFNHPLNQFQFTNALSINANGGFVHCAIQYYPSGRSLNMNWTALTLNGKEIHGSQSTESSGILFASFKQVIRNLFTMPRAYLGAIARRYLMPSKALAYVFMGAKWDRCTVQGELIGTNIQAVANTFDPPLQEQIDTVESEWRKAGYSLIHSSVMAPMDYARGSLDGNGVVAFVDSNYVMPPLGESMAQIGAENNGTMVGAALSWDEVGGFLLDRNSVVSHQIVETDILLNQDFVKNSWSEFAFSVMPADFFQNTLMHEYGHHIGLSHSSLSDLMRVNSQGKRYEATVGPDDVVGVKALYNDCL